jgi:hypothetical protein
VEGLLSRGLPRLSVADTLAAAAAAAASGSASWRQQQEQQEERLQLERKGRLEAESTAAELRQQLDDISALLFSYRRQQQPECSGSSDGGSSSTPALPALLGSVLQEAAAQSQLAAHDAADAAYVARMVAGVCARAAAAADLGQQWEAERAVLKRRLEQAALMGEAMLKHQKEHSAGGWVGRWVGGWVAHSGSRGCWHTRRAQAVRPLLPPAPQACGLSCCLTLFLPPLPLCADAEPWRQQLLNTTVSVGCLFLGAAAAVLIIRRSQAL